MRVLLWSAAAALVLVQPASAGDRTIRTLSEDMSTAGLRRIELRLPPGSVRIEPSRDGNVHVDLDVRCSTDLFRCEEKAEQLTLESSRGGSTLEVRVEGMGLSSFGLNVRGRIEVPSDRALEVDFPAGELSVDGVRGDLEVDVGAGEVHIAMREADVRSVRLGVGIGEASLAVAGRGIARTGWLAQKVRWGEGAGPSRVAVSLGVGELSMRLD